MCRRSLAELLILSPLLCTHTGLCLFIVSVDTSLILWNRFHVEYLIITQVANKFLVSYTYLFTYSLILWHFERNAHSTLSTVFCCHLNLGLPIPLLPLFFPQVYSQIFCKLPFLDTFVLDVLSVPIVTF